LPGARDSLRTHLVVCHGAQDGFIKNEDLAAFMTGAVAHNADLTFISYPDALHAFTNPKATQLGKQNELDIAYNEAADKQSWQSLTSFLKKLFAK